MQDAHAIDLTTLHSETQLIVTDANSEELRVPLQALELGNLPKRLRTFQRADDFLDTTELANVLNRLHSLKQAAVPGNSL